MHKKIVRRTIRTYITAIILHVKFVKNSEITKIQSLFQFCLILHSYVSQPKSLQVQQNCSQGEVVYMNSSKLKQSVAKVLVRMLFTILQLWYQWLRIQNIKAMFSQYYRSSEINLKWFYTKNLTAYFQFIPFHSSHVSFPTIFIPTNWLRSLRVCFVHTYINVHAYKINLKASRDWSLQWIEKNKMEMMHLAAMANLIISYIPS